MSKQFNDYDELTDIDPEDWLLIQKSSTGAVMKVAAENIFAPDSLDSTKVKNIEHIELGRASLTSSADEISVSFTAKTHLRVLFFGKQATNTITCKFQFNSDTSTNYSFARETDGTYDATTSYDSWSVTPGYAADIWTTLDIDNQETKEKCGVVFTNHSSGTGGANIPHRRELVCKWANTSAQISSIRVFNDGAGDFAAGTYLIVLGSDY